MEITGVSKEEALVLYEMAQAWLRYYRPTSEMVGTGTDMCAVFLTVCEETLKESGARVIIHDEEC